MSTLGCISPGKDCGVYFKGARKLLVGEQRMTNFDLGQIILAAIERTECRKRTGKQSKKLGSYFNGGC